MLAEDEEWFENFIKDYKTKLAEEKHQLITAAALVTARNQQVGHNNIQTTEKTLHVVSSLRSDIQSNPFVSNHKHRCESPSTPLVNHSAVNVYMLTARSWLSDCSWHNLCLST